MNYRKFKADHLFTGFKLLNNTEVLITSGDGEILTILNEKDAGHDIETFQGIICPGFVNAHCHLELSHMAGLIPEKTGLVDFVYKVMNERHRLDQEIMDAISKTEDQMIENGIVAVGDICNNNLTLLQKKLRRLHYYNFIETSGWNPAAALSTWQKSNALYEEFIKEDLIAAVVPHAPYSVSEELWETMVPFFKDQTITIHNQETIFENEFFLTGTGDFLRMYKMLNIDTSFFSPFNKTSLQTFFYRLSGALSVILVHNTFITQEDIDYVRENKPRDQLVSFCLCPNANLYIEHTLPPIEKLIKNNCLLILGTDSLASNRTVSILDELKTLHHYFPSLSLQQMLQWATINGARALQMDKVLGSFEKGKKPGVVLIKNTGGVKFAANADVKKIL